MPIEEIDIFGPVDPLEKIQRARFQLSMYEPFLSAILHEFDIRLDPEGRYATVKTAAIDLKNKVIYFYPQFVEVLTIDELIFVLAHEAFHVLQYAKERELVVGKDPILWNLSTDYIDNLTLHDFRIGTMPQGLYFDPETETYNREGIGNPVSFPFSELFRGWTSEEVYKWLKKNSQKVQLSPTVTGVFIPAPAPCPVCGGSGQVPDPSTGTKKPCPHCGGSGVVPGEEGTTYIPVDVQYGAPTSHKEIEDYVDTVAKAWGIAKAPTAWARIVDEILRPELPWNVLLMRYIREVARADYRWIPPSKKTWAVGVYLPGLRGEKFKAVIAIDSSGSITKEEFVYFVSETLGILRAFEEIDIWVLVCDDLIRGYQHIIAPWQRVDPEIFKGGGGTDYNPVFEFIKANRIRPNVLIYFTDLECGAECFPPVPPPYPVIWVCTQLPEQAYKPPFGEVIWYRRRKM
jgi:predicted metal-dependent peptidase